MKRNTVLLAAFGVAMGFLEAVVVVYLRQLYYPEGFAFPLKILAFQGLSLEYLREISTIVMLLLLSLMAGRTAYERFAYFLYCFGIWDIFYYAWLKVLLNWPQSLLTWDVLFLIPVVWVGPVLAPMLCALTMVISSALILSVLNKGQPVKLTLPTGATTFLGISLIFITFISDYLSIIMREGFLGNLPSLAVDPRFRKVVTGHVPTSYNWPLFMLGEALILCSLINFLRSGRNLH